MQGFVFLGAVAGYGAAFQPSTTTYDYHAPITEARDPDPVKYFGIQNAIYEYANYKNELPPKATPRAPPKGKYGKVYMQAVLSAFDTANYKYSSVYDSYEPKTFEEMSFYDAYVFYQTYIPQNFPDSATLSVPDLHDRAKVYLDYQYVSTLSRTQYYFNSILSAPSEKSLILLVESQGHVNYGNETSDQKGISTTTQLNGQTLYNWEMTTLPMQDVSWVYDLPAPSYEIEVPAFFTGEFFLPYGRKPLDTFFDSTNWGKGVLFINDCNLGRYWYIGPQVTLYVPATCLKAYPNPNKIALFETEFVPDDKSINFVDQPYITKTPPSFYL